MKVNKSSTKYLNLLPDLIQRCHSSKNYDNKKTFKKGTENVEDEPYSGSSILSTHDENVEVMLL